MILSMFLARDNHTMVREETPLFFRRHILKYLCNINVVKYLWMKDNVSDNFTFKWLSQK